MCTGFQVPSTRSRDFAEQIQGSARWGLRPDLLRPSPDRATSQAPPSVAEERGGFRGGGHLSLPRSRQSSWGEIHSISTASTKAVLTPASLPTAVPAPAPADIARVPHDTEPAIVLVPLTLSVHVPGQ